MEIATTTRVNGVELSRLYQEHGQSIYRQALRILRNRHEAEDAAQEVFVRVLDTKAAYKGSGEFRGWLSRITTHHCLNQIRNTKRRSRLLELHVKPGCERHGVPPLTERVALKKLFLHADKRQLQAALYVHMYGLSCDEAAAQLGVSSRTVRNLLSRLQRFCEKG